jgi:uncharacterized protein YxjI
MAEGYITCTKCSWINRSEDLICNACGVSLPRSSTSFAPTTSSTTVQPLPNSYSSTIGPSVATLSNPHAFHPQPSAPTQAVSYSDFGSSQNSVSSVPFNHSSIGSHLSTNVNTPSAMNTHYETTPFVNSVAPVTRPHERVDDFTSGFGSGSPYSGSQSHNNNSTLSQSFQTLTPSLAFGATTVMSTNISTSTPSVYRIREKFWGFGDNFTIEDSNWQPCYIVKGTVFSIGDQLSFQNINGKEVAAISQQCFNILPNYKIKQNGRVVAELQKEFTLIAPKITMRVHNVDSYSIKGNFFHHNFTFTRKGREVATVSKSLIAFTDSYGVKVMPGEDAVIILCACIIIDQMLHDS